MPEQPDGGGGADMERIGVKRSNEDMSPNNMKKQCIDLRAQIVNKDEKIGSLTSELERKNQKLVEYQTKVMKLTKVIAANGVQAVDLSAEIETKKAEVLRIERVLEGKNQEVSTLTAMLNAPGSEIAILNVKVQDQEMQLIQAAATIKEQKNKLETADTVTKELRKKMDDYERITIPKLEKKCKTLTEQRDKKAANAEKAKKDLEDMQDEYTILKNDSDRIEAENEEGRKLLSEGREVQNALIDEINEMQAVLISDETNASLMDLLCKRQAEIEKLSNELRLVQAQADASKKTLAEWKDEHGQKLKIEQQQGEITKLQRKLETQNTLQSCGFASKLEMKETNRKLTEENYRLNAIISNCDVQTMNAVRSRLDETMHQLNTLKKNPPINALNQSITSKEEENARLSRENCKLARRLRDVQIEVQDSKDKITEHEKTIKEKERYILQQQADITAPNMREMVERLHASDKAKKNADKEVENTKSKCQKDKQQAETKRRNDVNEEQQKTMTLLMRQAEYAHKAQEAENARETAVSRLETIKDQKQRLLDKVKRLEGEKSEAETQIEGLKETSKENETKLKDAAVKIKKTKQLQTDLAAANKRIGKIVKYFKKDFCAKLEKLDEDYETTTKELHALRHSEPETSKMVIEIKREEFIRLQTERYNLRQPAEALLGTRAALESSAQGAAPAQD